MNAPTKEAQHFLKINGFGEPVKWVFENTTIHMFVDQKTKTSMCFDSSMTPSDVIKKIGDRRDSFDKL